MMNSDIENEAFAQMLGDYMTPPEDNGFSEKLLSRIHQDQARKQRFKYGLLAGSSFMGGLIAATQIKAAFGLMEKAEFTINNNVLYGVIILFAFVLWSAFDNKDAGTL